MDTESESGNDNPRKSRRESHPKEGPSDLIKWLLGPFQLAPRGTTSRAIGRRGLARPRDLPKTSRFRARRRTRRICLMWRLRTIKWLKRILYSILLVVSVAVLVLWAKFAIVFNPPAFLQQGNLQGAYAYVVYKSWWFGPFRFNLSGYTLDPEAPQQSLVMQLERYQDIVTNPNEIVYIWTRSSTAK